MKRQTTDWQKIFANHISKKGLVPRIYKESSKLNSKNTNNPVTKWAKDINRHFTDEYKDGQSAHENPSLAIREMQIKTMRYHDTLMGTMENSDNTKCCKHVEKLGHSHIAGGNVKWYRYFGK